MKHTDSTSIYKEVSCWGTAQTSGRAAAPKQLRSEKGPLGASEAPRGGSLGAEVGVGWRMR